MAVPRRGATVLRSTGAASDILPRASLALAPAHGDGTRGRIADREPPRARVDPRDTIINVHLAWHHWIAREWDSAIEASERTRAIDARDHWPPFFHGLALALRGEPTFAVDQLRRSLTLSGDSPVMLGALGWGLAMAGSRDEARDILERMHHIAESRQVAAYEIAVIYAALDERDQAFDWLDRAYEERSAWLPYIRVEPRLDPLRGDERFTSLVVAVTGGRWTPHRRPHAVQRSPTDRRRAPGSAPPAIAARWW